MNDVVAVTRVAFETAFSTNKIKRGFKYSEMFSLLLEMMLH